MATVLLASVTTIVQAVQTQLINSLSFPAERVRITAHWPPYQTQADQVVYIWPKESARDATVSDGSGRRSTVVRRVFWIILDSRLSTDDIGGAENWLNDPSYG